VGLLQGFLQSLLVEEVLEKIAGENEIKAGFGQAPWLRTTLLQKNNLWGKAWDRLRI
jgi:hypothetical protein